MGFVQRQSCNAGVEEHCEEYRYVEQRQGWEAEQRRLKKELEKHNKQATKVRACLELCSSLLVLGCSCHLYRTCFGHTS